MSPMRLDSANWKLDSLALVIALVFGACGTGGYLVTKNQLKKIQIGTSTKQDVQELLGSPQTTLPPDASKRDSETWVYTYSKYSSDPYAGVPPIGMTSVPISRNRPRTSELVITFDDKGIVSNIQEKSEP